MLQAALPILQELIQAGEEEDACIQLLSSILEVLYQAQKVNQESVTRPNPSQWGSAPVPGRDIVGVQPGGVTVPAGWDTNLVLSTSASFCWVAKHPHEWGRGFRAQG